jgi:hypothetical protein
VFIKIPSILSSLGRPEERGESRPCLESKPALHPNRLPVLPRLLRRGGGRPPSGHLAWMPPHPTFLQTWWTNWMDDVTWPAARLPRRRRCGRCPWIASRGRRCAGTTTARMGRAAGRSRLAPAHPGGSGATRCRSACRGGPTWYMWATWCVISRVSLDVLGVVECVEPWEMKDDLVREPVDRVVPCRSGCRKRRDRCLSMWHSSVKSWCYLEMRNTR